MKTETISWEQFEQVELRVGTITEVHSFPEARKPAYKLVVDFGKKIGPKKVVLKSQIYIPKRILSANR